MRGVGRSKSPEPDQVETALVPRSREDDFKTSDPDDLSIPHDREPIRPFEPVPIAVLKTR